MSKKKISDVRADAIVRMKELGFTVADISRTLGVSRVTVYDHTDPEYYKRRKENISAHVKRTTLTMTIKGKRVHLKHLNKRSRPEGCELCKATGKKLYYHVSEEASPSLGLWLCGICRIIGDIVDTLGAPSTADFSHRYVKLVNSVMRSNKSAGNKNKT